MRANARIRVDLPQAFGPMIAVNEPSGMSTVRSWETVRWS